MKKLILEGECVMSENEGGFTAPTIEVGEHVLDRQMLLFLAGSLPFGDRAGALHRFTQSLGKIRITVERIE